MLRAGRLSVKCKIEDITTRPYPAQVSRAPAARYLPALTGLRFALALWVILHHLTGRNMLLAGWAATLPAAVQSILHGGYLAVQTFFLLSGFVLAQSYASTRWHRRNLARFAVARVARTVPAYLLSLAVVAWFIVQFLLKPGRSAMLKLSVLADYVFLLQGWTGSMGIGWNTPAWSLSCEFFFYACFPLLLIWLGRGGLLRTYSALAASFVVPVLLAHAGLPSQWKPLHHLSDFVAGIAAAAIYRAIMHAGATPKWLGAAFYLPALAAGAAFIVFPHVLDGALFDLNTVLRPLNVALLIGLACGDGFLARTLAGKTVDYLGQASYSMYILHIPLLWWYSRYTTFRWGSVPPAWVGFVFIAAVIGVSIAAFEFVETRANSRIRTWAASRLEQREPVALRPAA